MVRYDTNVNIVPILFANFVGVEFHEYWYKVFKSCRVIEEFDVSRRTIIVDQEKSIDT